MIFFYCLVEMCSAITINIFTFQLTTVSQKAFLLSPLMPELVKEGRRSEPQGQNGEWTPGWGGFMSTACIGAGGTNTDSWSVSFPPRLELVASRRVAPTPCRTPLGTHLPWQGLLADAPPSTHCYLLIPITVQAMHVVNNTMWQCP